MVKARIINHTSKHWHHRQHATPLRQQSQSAAASCKPTTHTILVPRAIQTHRATIATTLSSPPRKLPWAKSFSTSRHNRNHTLSNYATNLAISPFHHLTISASGSRFVGAPQTLSKTKFRLAKTPHNVIIVKPRGNVNMFLLFLHFILIFFHFYMIFFQLMVPTHKLSH